ncbi:unnamed protein product [Brachionus calyciflorus]|uniref:WH2 domain-containing protein n=1 Tax=Brachionus calyciflorus TaxID=104777 RepID=A0A813W319_9BILA|nr:unnamed protein product [Brachionus calyciflorus]
MTSNRATSRMNSHNENLGIHDSFDRKHRVRNQSCSASSTMSSASSNSSSATTSLNENFLIDVLIVYPNGIQITRKLDTRKAVYDILIELSATAKLIPTNYTLKLFSKNESDVNNYKLIDYTPNQTIGILNPSKINILPKTSTLKHQQHQLLTSVEPEPSTRLLNQFLTVNTFNNKSSTLSKTPFELTIRVSVNLPFNQKTAVRVKPDIFLGDLFECICKEAGLDQNRYDLVINSQIIQTTLHQETLDLFKTNEVSLVLKNYERSRLNLSNSLGNTKQCEFKNSTSNISIKNNQSNMFSFFTRKKHQKSKSKLSINDDVTSLKSSTLRFEHKSDQISMKSVSSSQLDNQYLLTRAIKKRPAPPPPSSSNLKIVPEVNETFKQEEQPVKIRSKSVINDRNTLSEIDREALNKLMVLTKKKTKAAPLPPTQQISQEKRDIINVINNISPKSISSNENLSLKDQDSDKNSTSPQSFPSPSLSESSSVMSNKSDESEKSSDKKENNLSILESQKNQANKNSFSENLNKKQEIEKCRESDYDSITGPSVSLSLINDTQSIIHNHTTSTQIMDNQTKVLDKTYEPDESTLNDTSESRKINDDSILISDENCVKSFYGAVSDHKIYSEDDFSDIESIKTINSPFITTSPLNNNKYSVQNMPNQVTKIVINKNLETPKLDTKIPNVLAEANDRSSVQNYDTECDETINSNNYSDDDSKQLEINVNTHRTPVKQTAVIEVRPEFETSSLITYVNQNEQNNPIMQEIPAHKKERSSVHLMIKSPVSPPPQFPAIGADEINEQHQNYTVVRSGDIIEKNGIYYSTDGTIRGYSGIVKKLANSKALQEVFQKQQETENLNTSPVKSSIGKIVENEKKLTPTFKNVQLRRSTENRNFSKSTLDEELSKKLETRRQTISNQISNLEVDTSSNSSSVQSLSTSPSVNSSSQNSPQAYFMSQNLHSINQRKNSPAFVLSAKVRDSQSKGYNSPDSLAHSRASLLSELKSIVPLTDNETPSPSVCPMSTFQPRNVRPAVAPKNFNNTTIESIQNKKQLISARDDLLDSIKSFSATSLRKVEFKQ